MATSALGPRVLLRRLREVMGLARAQREIAEELEPAILETANQLGLGRPAPGSPDGASFSASDARIAASASQSIMLSVSGVSGVASTTKSAW